MLSNLCKSIVNKFVIDKYINEPLYKIYENKEEGCFYKRTSENETLVAKDISTNDPQVYLVSRIQEFLSAALTKNIPVIRYHTYSVSDNLKQRFIEEVNAHKLRSNS